MRSRPQSIAIAGCAIAAAWLAGYALLHLPGALPERYEARHWRAAWIGFDLAMACFSLATVVLLMRRSRLVPVFAAALAALLVADAWFDCLTAQRRDLGMSLLSLAVELPAAAFFLWIAVASTRSGAAESGDREPT